MAKDVLPPLLRALLAGGKRLALTEARAETGVKCIALDGRFVKGADGRVVKPTEGLQKSFFTSLFCGKNCNLIAQNMY